MNLIAMSIRRPVFAWTLMFGLIVFGAICMNRLGVSQMPDIDFPVIAISINYEGASPEVVEAELIDPIEQNLLSIEGIREMRSMVRQGGGNVILNLSINRNVDIALQEVQTALSQVRFPIGVDAPVVKKRNPEESPILLLGVSSTHPMRETLNWVENYLLDQFRFLPDIGEVAIGGFSQRNLRVWPDVKKLRLFDLTVIDVLDAIEAQHLETAAGQYANEREEFRARWLGEAATPEDVGKIRILRRGGQVIQDRVYRLADVARVEDGLTDIRRVSRIDGKDAISISIQKQRGANEVALAETVRKKVEQLKQNLPAGYDLRVNVDYTASTEAVVHTTYEKLIVAGIVTILICFLFLGSFQAALNILFSIPTSIVGTFMILYFSGFTLNLFTLLALTLAISIVVDDAIMLLENIVRHYRMGKTTEQAAYDGAMEILPAATAATLAVIAVFIPVVFMDGITGKFFFQFGITMSAAVLLSLLEAVTITPMRSAAFLATSPKTSRFERYLDRLFERVAHAYQDLLRRTLGWSKTVVFASLLVFLASLVLVRTVKQEFVPNQDQNIIELRAQTAPGASLEFTMKKAMELEKVIKENRYVESFVLSVGATGFNSGVNQINVPLYLKPRETRDLNHTQIMAGLRKQLKAIDGIKVSMRDVSARSLTSGRPFPVSFNLSGPDLKTLEAKSTEIMKRMEAEGLTTDLDTDFRLGLPEMLIRPDRDAMATRGVAVDAVAKTLNATVAGVRQNRFTSDGRRYDIRVKLPEDQVRTVDDIRSIEVRNNYGLRVPLSQLVSFKEESTFQAISRVNRQRAIGVFGNVAAGHSQGEVLARAETIAKEVLPPGYGFSLEGASAGLAESFRSMGFALLMGVLVAYMILAVQFNSFVHPVSVLVALPFSLTGAMLTLWLTGVSLNLFSFIGLVVLMGIAKKNSILLVEFTNHVRHDGETDVTKALETACPVRLRPILMTSIATIGAALPLVFGNSIGQETRTPMGLTLVGGTIVSTVFTLFVVPCLYRMLSYFESKKKIALDTDRASRPAA